MRELKFRVWSKDQKTYDYKFPYNSIGDFYVSTRGVVFSDFGNTITPEVRQESFIVEQYTGLKDINGNEIYENCELNGRYIVEYIAPSFIGRDIINGDIIELYDNKFTITKEHGEVSQNSERSID